MNYRLANLRGFEFLISVDDRARASGLWQYVAKPAVQTVSKVGCWTSSVIDRMFPPPKVEDVRPFPANPTPEQQVIIDEVQSHQWYHTIELGHGLRTPGRFNHYPLLADYHLPERLDGKRCLDVATMNGFWAFEMERRGAAEVVALDVARFGDVDMPARDRRAASAEQLASENGRPFRCAHKILGSKVRYEQMRIYELSSERLGKFDFVMIGDLLLHLMNPMTACNAIYEVTAGQAHFVECFSPFIPNMAMMYQSAAQATWWGLSLGAIERMIWDAGFETVNTVHKFKADSQPGQNAWMWRAVIDAKP
jgi:tRNA (mo5U34)-methyltransferase